MAQMLVEEKPDLCMDDAIYDVNRATIVEANSLGLYSSP